MSATSDRDFLPTAKWEMLKLRAELLRRLRRFFEDRGFVEVETPLLSHDSVVDLHIDPIPVSLFEDPRAPHTGQRMWLQSSPEFGMKRLLAAGADKIFQVTKAFRAAERGARHNPEFTIVEWYRLGDNLEQGVDLLAELACKMLPAQQVERISYATAFHRHLGINPHIATVTELSNRAVALGGRPPDSLGETRDEWLNFLLATYVEPKLGVDRPTILFDYPASQAALARTRRVDGEPGYEVAERFELYVEGVELANGYHELVDAQALRDRNRVANTQRAADGRYTVPEESRLLAAMDQGLPPCAGVALGFDRLVMIVSGARDIREVIPFPIDRA